MIHTNINFVTFFATSEGFGINTNIFETNILNLSVVIITLVYYGKIALGDIIKNRRENVVKNLQEIEKRVRESEETLALAKSKLETAKSQAEEIRQQGEKLSIQTAKSIIDTVEDDVNRLKSINLLTLNMREKKSLTEVCQKLSSLSFAKARVLIMKRLNSKFHKKLISRKIEKLSKLSKKKRRKKINK